MFNVEHAIKTWSQTCGTDSAISNEHRNELEAHLRDSIAQLQQSDNLSEEEAFLISRHRLGSPAVLQAEYRKVHRGEIWRQRTLLMVSGYLMISLVLKIVASEQALAGWIGLKLGLGITDSTNILTGLPNHASAMLSAGIGLIGLGVMVWLIRVLARGPQSTHPVSNRFFAIINSLIESPIKAAFAWLALYAGFTAVQPAIHMAMIYHVSPQEFGAYTGSVLIYGFNTQLLTILALVGIALRLSKQPRQKVA